MFALRNFLGLPEKLALQGRQRSNIEQKGTYLRVEIKKYVETHITSINPFYPLGDYDSVTSFYSFKLYKFSCLGVFSHTYFFNGTL